MAETSLDAGSSLCNYDIDLEEVSLHAVRESEVVNRTRSESKRRSERRVVLGKGGFGGVPQTQGITDGRRQGQRALPPSGAPGLSRISAAGSLGLPALLAASSPGS